MRGDALDRFDVSQNDSRDSASILNVPLSECCWVCCENQFKNADFWSLFVLKCQHCCVSHVINFSKKPFVCDVDVVFKYDVQRGLTQRVLFGTCVGSRIKDGQLASSGDDKISVWWIVFKAQSPRSVQPKGA